MTSREAASASKAHMIAIVALRMIREDPELVARLQEAARQDEVPFEADKINPFVLEMCEMALTLIGDKLLRHEGPVDEFDVIVPRAGASNSYERSAGALAVGSFTTEYVHSAAMEPFTEWVLREHPDAVSSPDAVTRSAVEDADHVLTLMAHVTGELARREAGEPEGEPEQVRYDGWTHV